MLEELQNQEDEAKKLLKDLPISSQQAIVASVVEAMPTEDQKSAAKKVVSAMSSENQQDLPASIVKDLPQEQQQPAAKGVVEAIPSDQRGSLIPTPTDQKTLGTLWYMVVGTLALAVFAFGSMTFVLIYQKKPSEAVLALATAALGGIVGLVATTPGRGNSRTQ